MTCTDHVLACRPPRKISPRAPALGRSPWRVSPGYSKRVSLSLAGYGLASGDSGHLGTPRFLYLNVEKFGLVSPAPSSWMIS